jgi:cation/acetate symporter
MTNMILITAALMFGTAGLPHVIVRFYTAKSVRAARYSALWALFFISLLYTAAPAIGAFSKLNILEQIPGTAIGETPGWFNTWSNVGLITVDDLNSDGIIDYSPLASGTNELTINNDIIVLATPEIAGLPAPVVGLVAAGALAAGAVDGLRPAAGHQLRGGQRHLLQAHQPAGHRGPAAHGRAHRHGRRDPGRRLPRHQPPGFVAQVVALAFGLAAASFFPVWCSGSSGRTARPWAPRPA